MQDYPRHRQCGPGLPRIRRSAGKKHNSLPHADTVPGEGPHPYEASEIFQISFSGYTLQFTHSALLSGNGFLPLSPLEYRLLRTLARHVNTPIPRQTLFRILDFSGNIRLVDACVSRLRKKLALCLSADNEREKPLTKKMISIRQVRGVGYGLWVQKLTEGGF